MQSIFSVAARRDSLECKIYITRRGGALKMNWTEPAAERQRYGH